MGTVYLLHFSEPYKHARHYLGYTKRDDLTERLIEHEKGAGARLLFVVKSAGITWQLARQWVGGRALERQLKKRGGAARICPICRLSLGGANTHSEPRPSQADAAEYSQHPPRSSDHE